MTDAAIAPPAEHTPVRLSAREIPPPPTISAAAKAALSLGASLPYVQRPAVGDLDAWRQAVIESNTMWDGLAGDMLKGCRTAIETRTIGGVKCYVCTPPGQTEGQSGRVYLYIHGGAFVFGAGAFARCQGALSAERLGITTVSVDYRMPPDHPFPAAPEDCVAVYRELIKTYDPAHAVIGGSSAGGNLAAAATLMIRDRGLPLPAGVILLTPEVDLTESGDTFATNELLDVQLKRALPECNGVYAGGHDMTDPYLSPLFADFSKGFPPTLVQSGTRDLFLSNSVMIHRKLRDAGVEAELHVWEAMPHGGFGFGDCPENAEINAELKRFIDRLV
jgi:acetyl esterase/lipase